MEQIKTIPKEKFSFVSGGDKVHDKKLDTKPVGYFTDAFRRFCKNKGSVVGAVIILVLILFAIIAPFCTPYNGPGYMQSRGCRIYARNNKMGHFSGCLRACIHHMLQKGHIIFRNQAL